MPIAPLLQRFVDDELTRSTALIERITSATLEQLRNPRDGGLSLQERQHYLDLGEALAQRGGVFRAAFVDALRRLVTADLRERATHVSDVPLGDVPGSLTLMDETRVEADIEIARASQIVDTAAEWELRELQTFTSTLVGQAHVSPESNPFRPLSYARALWDAASALVPTFVQRSLLLRQSSVAAASLLKMAFAAASSRLEAQGVQPGIYRTVVLAPGAVPQRSPLMSAEAAAATGTAPLPAVAVGQLLSPSVVSGRSASGAAASGAARATASGRDDRNLEAALQQIESMLRQLPPVPLAPPGARAPAVAAPRLRDHHDELVSSTSDGVDRQIIELLSRLFDMVLSDTRLPAAFRTLMARLQASALRVALNDPSMMSQHDHPVWALMDRIADVSALYTQAGDPRLSGLLAFCEGLVDRLARANRHDAHLYRQTLAQFDTFVQSQINEQLTHASVKVDELSRAEQRDQIQQQIAQRLADQIAALRAPIAPNMRHFVTGTWSRVLAVAMLDDGEEAESTASYMKALDDLLWSLNLPDHPQSRQRLVGLLPSLLQRLRSGMTLIELPAVEQQHVLDELMAAHTEALRPARQTDGDLSPEQIVQMLRDEPAPAPGMAPAFGDSLIDLASMETVPAELIDSAAVPDAAETADHVGELRPGDGRRLFLRGRWTRALLLWRSAGGQYFLFASESPGRTHAITRQALTRLHAEKLLLPLEERSLTQRAVEALVHEMGTPA